jgi:hypothetical protein
VIVLESRSFAQLEDFVDLGRPDDADVRFLVEERERSAPAKGDAFLVELMDLLREARRKFTRGGEQVVLGARGPNIGPAEEPLGQIFNVFTLRDGRIVRIDDYRGRREALTAAGVAEDVDWR